MATAQELDAGLQKFTADNPWIFQLIKYFDGETMPIPWGQVGIRSNYLQYMASTYNNASMVVGQLDFSPAATTSEQATQAAKQMFDQSKGFWEKATASGSIAWEAFSGGGMVVFAEALSVFVGTAFLQMQKGYNLHTSGVVTAFLQQTDEKVAQLVRSGQITQEKGVQILRDTELALQRHATSLNEGFSAINYMNKKGLFDSQKKATGDFGASALVAMTIVGVALIAAIALAFVSCYQTSAMTTLIEEQCSKYTNERLRLACTKAATEKIPKIDFGEIAGQFSKYLMYGLLLVGAVYFAPTIVKKLSEARKASR